MTMQKPTVICILLILLLNSCRVTKEISAGEEALNLKTEREFFAAFYENTFQYNTLSARLQFEIAMPSGNSASSRGQLRIIKDNRLQLSIQPMLGIEAIRAELTPDSIKIVNRLNKWYMVDAFDNLKGNTAIDFNFSNLQSLFTNRLFLPGETGLTAEQFNFFRWEQTQTGYILRTNDRTGFQYAFSSDANEKLYATEIKDADALFSLQCDYLNFRAVDRQFFPMQLNIRLNTESNAQYSLSLQFSQIEIDAPLSLSFPVPTNYRQVSFQQMLQSFTAQ